MYLETDDSMPTLKDVLLSSTSSRDEGASSIVTQVLPTAQRQDVADDELPEACHSCHRRPDRFSEPFVVATIVGEGSHEKHNVIKINKVIIESALGGSWVIRVVVRKKNDPHSAPSTKTTSLGRTNSPRG